MSDIFSELIGDLDKDPSQSSTSHNKNEQAFKLPEGAKPYIPAHIWNKLTRRGEPRRGVLLNALDRVRSVLYLISTYLPQHIVHQKMRRPVCGQFQGHQVRGTLLFSDVSGFTALSERLAVLGNEGAEQLTEIMNGYFENMLEILAWSGGVLLKFAGDATLVYFVEQEGDAQAQSAVRTAQRMMVAMSQFQKIDTPLGSVSLKMKIGISTGHFLEAHIGSPERMEYVVLGPTVNQTMNAEGSAVAGMIVVDQATANQLDPTDYQSHSSGLFTIQQDNVETLGDFEVKAQSRRARGSIPWNANPHAIATQMEVAVRQINALTPYLAQELVDNIVANAKKRRIASEFRPTTVIFCNFTGFEILLEQWGDHGPRRVAKMLSQFFQAAQEIIGGLGGVVTRIDPYSQGSKMLILFGAPTAHEDDPQRAAGAALALQAKIVDLNQEWQKKFRRQLSGLPNSEIKVQLKIGITHGRTFAGQVGAATRREYTVMGDDVNLSARLMSAAKPGQILLNVPVHDKINNYFITNPLDPIQVKGKSEPIPIFELVEKISSSANRPIRSQDPIFGRLQELSLSQKALKRASQGQGQRLQILGTAGIGKSHLINNLFDQAEKAAVKIHLDFCHSFTAQSPYAIWIQFIRTLATITDIDNQDAASQKLVTLLNQYGMNSEEHGRPIANLLGLRIKVTPSETSATKPKPTTKAGGGSTLFAALGKKVSSQAGHSRPTLDLSRLTDRQPSKKPAMLWQQLQIQVASREKARLFNAILQLLNKRSAEQPLFLIFENAQWLDPASQELLDFIGPKLHEAPLLILTIHRELTDASDASQGQQLNLGPLSIEATTEFVNHLLERPLEPNLLQKIHTHSSGNPLFIREMTLWLQRNQGSNQSGELAKSLMASMSIQELILSRVDNLPQAAREILKSAAIIGNEFETADLQSLLHQQKGEYDLTDALHDLTKAQLLSATTPEKYTFQQTLVREIIYNSQSFSKRRQAHHFIANHLEERHRDNINQSVTLLAYHFEQAENWPKAGRYKLIAAHRARQRFAYPLATTTYGQALTLFTRLPLSQRVGEVRNLMVEAHIGQGDMALLKGEMVTAAFAYQSAVHLLSAIQQPIPPALQIKVALTLPCLGREREAEAILRPLLKTFLSAKDGTAAAAALAWLLWRAKSNETKAWLKRARQNAEKLTDNGWAAGILAFLTEWQGDLNNALEAYQSFGLSDGIILTSCRLGDRALKEGKLEEAQSHYQRALKTAEEQDDSDQPGFALALYRTAEVEWHNGNGKAAIEHLNHALATLPGWFTDERQKISEARLLIEAEDMAEWPGWRWQSYDDAFRISLLLNADMDTHFSKITI